jgi:hypothetical protein
MTRNTIYKASAASALMATLLLAACGGSDGSGNSGNAGSSSSASSQSSSAVSSASSSTSSSSSSSANTVTAQVCPTGDSTVYFCDDFQSGTTANWDLGITNAGTAAGFSVIAEPGVAGNNKVMYYDAQVDTTGGVIAVLKDTVWATVAAAKQTDYFFEARIKPLKNGTSGNKQLYLLSRYQGATSWNHGGLNLQNANTSTKVEAGYAKAGTPSRSQQISFALDMGTATTSTSADLSTWAPAGQWYTVRFEQIGTQVVVYVDGKKVVNWTADTASAPINTTAGKIGLWSANRSFLIDDIKVGDPSIKPVELSLSPSALTYTAEEGDAAYTVAVTAVKSDGTTADTFTVVSSNPSVVSVSKSGNNVTLTPGAAGTANVTFTSGSDSSVKRTIAVTINPGFVMPTSTYGDLSGDTLPAAGATAAYADGMLSLTFDSAPTLGTAGAVRIFDANDNSVVDTIKLAGDGMAVGPAVGGYYRGLSMPMIKIAGNTLKIRPHMNKLTYGKTYYVAIANGAVTGTLNGSSFSGLGKAANWSFTTKAAPATGLTTLTVDDDGSTADFRTVQGALNYAMANVATDTAVTINVKNGTYDEPLYLRGKNNVTIKGESRTGAVIAFENYETLNTGSGAGSTSASAISGGGRALFLAETSDLLTLDTITLKNTHLRSTALANQAETIYFANDAGRLIANNAEFHSEQDTILVKGYNWFYNSLITGNVDFIWGYSQATLFENSEIRTVGDTYYGTTASGGYILQARNPAGAKGFVFLNSSLTKGVGPGGNTVATGTTYLARSGGDSTYQDNVAFINCKMDDHIAAKGWYESPAPTPGAATASTGWREFGSTNLSGTAIDVSARSSYSKQLTTTEAGALDSRAEVFSAFNGGAGWTPSVAAGKVRTR